MNPRVRDVTPLADYKLHIVFDNGERGVYNCAALLDFGVFRELRNPVYFQRVRVRDGTVTWPNAQDICPDTLYLEAAKSCCPL